MSCSNKSIAELIEDIRSDKAEKFRSAGRLMTLSERTLESTMEILSALSSFHLPRIILGITGAPGSGKSFLTNRLIAAFRERYPERMIGVIAVDPSSPFSGGAILGDRIRMMSHATDPNVFIRSIASRGQFGGVTFGTRGIISVLGLLGCDTVLVETVGVGQMEFAVRDVTDAVAIVLSPGQGDTMQFLKAGLMEVGDLFIINKADRPDTAQFHAQLLSVLGEEKPIRLTSARDNTGVSELLEAVEKFFEGRETEILRQSRLEHLIKRAILFEFQKRAEAVIEREGKGLSKKVFGRETFFSSLLGELIEKIK
jgi:LAO/AO transport system kinase